MSEAPAFTDLAAAAAAAPPVAAVVLGSGMGGVARGLQVEYTLPFTAIPGLAVPSVAGHRGLLSLGTWAGKRVLVFQGRLHYYEGHSWEDVTAPVRLAHALGAKVLLLTNAAGGIHESLDAGSLLVLRDHLEWTRPCCWRQPGPGGLGPARPSPYAPRLVDLLLRAAGEVGLPLFPGVYAALTGPCYETPAEIRALQRWGADAVGMSTAREAQAGSDLGMECAALSLITNRAAGLVCGPINHEEVLTAAARQLLRLEELVGRFFELG